MSGPNEHSRQLSEGEFMRLFLQHEPALRAFARSILPDWEAVDDALQEASVTMWEKLGQLRDENGFLPWAKVILRFKCLSAVAASRRQREVFSDEVLQLLADEAESMSRQDVADLRHALSTCLARFSDAHQQLLLAPYTGVGRVKQLAEECGKPVNALYKLLGRLRGKLGACVRGQLQAEMS